MGTQHQNYRLTKVLKIIDKKSIKARTILDFGCGDGAFAIELGKHTGATSIFGVDISNRAIELAREKGISGDAIDIDTSNLNYADNTFDLVFCGSLIEDVLNPDHMMTEIRRVLAPDGICILTHPNMCAWANRIAINFGYLPFYYRVSTKFVDIGKIFGQPKEAPSTGFIRLFNPRSFKQFAQLHNFRVEGIYGAKEKLPHSFEILDSFFSHFPSVAFQNIYIY